MRSILINCFEGFVQPLEETEIEADAEVFVIDEIEDEATVVAFDSADRQSFACPLSQWAYGSEMWIGKTKEIPTGVKVEF